MFENLDDPLPPTPAPLDGVAARGRRLRRQRRMIAGAVCALVLAGSVATGAALQTDGHKKVIVSSDSTTSTVATTVPDSTPTSTTPGSTIAVVPASSSTTSPSTASTATTATTQPPHDPTDLSLVTVTYAEDPIAINAGEMRAINVTVTNTGSWTVQLTSACHGPTLWARPATSAWAPYTAGIWPEPYPERGVGASDAGWGCIANQTQLAAGASTIWHDEIIAGYRDAAGNIMPSPPGFTSYRPNFLPQCAQPCDPDGPNSIPVTIFAPTWPPPPSLYTVDVRTLRPTAASGDSTGVEMTYTNGLAFSIETPLWGPCWTVKSGWGTIDCSGARPMLIIGPHTSVDLVGTIWARAGFVSTGAPLAPGKYPLDLGDLQGSRYPMSDTFPYLRVT